MKPSPKLSEAETALDQSKTELSSVREAAARDLSFQASRAKAEAALARADSEATLAQLGEEYRKFREKTVADEEAGAARLESLREALATERDQLSVLKRAREEDVRRQTAEAAAAAAAADASLAEERERFRVFREEASAREEAEAERVRSLRDALTVELEKSSASATASAAAQRQLEDSLAVVREEFRAFREAASGVSEAKLSAVEDDLAAERERSEASEASREQLEAELAAQGKALAEVREDYRRFRDGYIPLRIRDEARLQTVQGELASEQELRKASEASKEQLEADLGKQGEALAKEREDFRVFRENAEGLGEGKDAQLRKVEGDLAAEREQQELGNLRVASAAAEAGGAQAAMATRKQQQQLYGNVGSSGRSSVGMPGAASRRENAVDSDDDGAAVAGGDMTRTFSLSSEEEIDSSGESSGLGAIVEEADSSGTESSAAEEEDSESEGEEGGGVPGYGGKMSVVQEGDEESESDGGRSSFDGVQEAFDRAVENEELSADDAKDAGSAGAARLSLSPLAPRLDYSDDRPSADPPVSATYAAAAAMFDRNKGQQVGVHRGGRSTSARRISMSLSPRPAGRRPRGARASVTSGVGGYRPAGSGDNGGGCAKSLSPLPLRGGKKSRASWSPGAGLLPHAAARLAQSPPLSCLSPMVRLAPADHGLGREGNTVVLELGAWRVRAGVVTPSGEEGKSSSYFDDFPCCVARPSKEGADLGELVNGASSLAAPMYSKFREEDTVRLADHAYGLLKQDSSLSPTLLTYKPTATVDEVLALASVLLEVHRVPAIRMVNEAQLAALAVGVKVGVIVDIGESGVSVTPIFDGFPVPPAVRSECCGGGDVTKFLDYMLLSRTNEHFNQMTDRRRLEYTREMKEEHCYVPLDFALEVEEYGAFKRKAMRVCKGAQASPMLSGYEACDSRDFIDDTDTDEEVTKTKTFTLKSGSELDVKIGRERFHAPEILFTASHHPGLWNEGGVSRSLSQVVLDALAELDSDTKADMLDDIVLVGGSARMDGLGDRLEEDLKAMLPEWMSEKVDVRVPAADELNHRNRTSRGDPSAVTVGAEILLEEGAGSNDHGTKGGDWITTAQWAETPEVLTRALVPFLSE
ncbi:unnamed protein product [Ectocarpus sp. CCAP 1310/34]|nr:unnamed protein product [Ectocarpus sp. CCAP 1310/34]